MLTYENRRKFFLTYYDLAEVSNNIQSNRTAREVFDLYSVFELEISVDCPYYFGSLACMIAINSLCAQPLLMN